MFAIGDGFIFLHFSACQELNCGAFLILKFWARLSESTDCCFHYEQCLYFENIFILKKKTTKKRLKITLVAKNTVDRNREFTALFCRLTCALGFIIGLELPDYAEGYG